MNTAKETAAAMSLSEFYSADAETLRIKYKQIESLIGLGHHAPSEGDYCEALLKEFLRRTLPRHFSVDSGFIRRVSDTDWLKEPSGVLPPESPLATPQLDIIVHDSSDYAPLFRSEDVVVVVPEAVRAVIEVKKCLRRKDLDEAVKNIATTRKLLRRWRHQSYRVFTCIFAFRLGEELSPATKDVSKSFENCFALARDEHDGFCQAPDLLMALPEFALHQTGGNVAEFYHCPTVSNEHGTTNIAGQLLLFLLAHHTNMALARALPFPEPLRSTRRLAFKIDHLNRDEDTMRPVAPAPSSP